MCSRTDIPLLIGRKVELEELVKHTAYLNGEIGIVIGWNEDEEKFEVKLDCDESIQSIKPANLTPLDVSLGGFACVYFDRPIDLNDSANIERGIQLIQFAASDDSDPKAKNKVFTAGLQWCYDLFKEYSQNYKIIKKIQKIAQYMIENSNFPDFKIEAKIFLAKILISKDQNEKAVQILYECCENHYGCLPLIFKILSERILTGNASKIVKIYFQAKPIVENQTYRLFVDTNKDTGILDFYTNAMLLLNHYHIRNKIPNFKKEVKYIYRKLTKFQEVDVEEHTNYLLALAAYAFNQSDWDVVLNKANQFQSISSKLHGYSGYIALAYQFRIHAYLAKYNKDMAKKCLQKYKRYIKNMVHDKKNGLKCVKELENLIKKMPTKHIRARLKSSIAKSETLRHFEKCANLECTKTETLAKRFHVCSRCKLAHYCSKKCQREHWKAKHKRRCCVEM